MSQVLDAPQTAELDDRDRRALARLWGVAARSGVHDVALLGELVLVLTALGAPLALVGRAAGCAAEQAGSAEAAARLAGAYGGEPLTLPPALGLLRRTPGGVRRPRAALRRLAVRALRDGCLEGGHVAQVTCWASATSQDPAVRAALTVIARSEARAAALWADVLAWALVQRPRLAGRLRDLDLAERSPLVGLLASVQADPAVLAAHGWPRAAEVERMWAVHRPAVLARVS